MYSLVTRFTADSTADFWQTLSTLPNYIERKITTCTVGTNTEEPRYSSHTCDHKVAGFQGKLLMSLNQSVPELLAVIGCNSEALNIARFHCTNIKSIHPNHIVF